ncbi:uncharacterized protein LOC100199094 isoform X1 [Hydra vulgaris]|uniref:uncharacterized protein LOC100199094 isoform X1 n=1 Tax=Hydra vulgaris TaxID=6087 RepID=UPI0002B475D1|nr:uncharacterized protein LOC100199094 [Hydra vulgaris]
MVLSWYALAAVACGVLLGSAFIVFIIAKSCFRKPKNYDTLIQTDDELEKGKTQNKVDFSMSSSIENVNYITESNADSATSEAESYETVSAYGDSLSFQKHQLNESINIQIMFFLNTKHKNIYVAGKVANVTNLVSNMPKGQYKVHIVLLPIKRYIIKTKWYDVKKTIAVIDEYFKFIFQTNPDLKKSTLRVRVYSRHNKHAFKSESCVGECFIKLSEIKEDKACILRRAISVNDSKPDYQ